MTPSDGVTAPARLWPMMIAIGAGLVIGGLLTWLFAGRLDGSTGDRDRGRWPDGSLVANEGDVLTDLGGGTHLDGLFHICAIGG